MDFLQALGSLLSFAAFALIAAGVLKAFQMQSDLSEVKDLLRDIKRNTEDHSPATYAAASERGREVLLKEMDESAYLSAIEAAVAHPVSPEPLARAVESAIEPPQPVLQPEVVPPPLHKA